MSLGNSNFDELSEADLANLITVGVPEGILVEYKRDLYGASDSEVKEFLKDTSSFANTAGGHLIVGMEEAGGVASRITPIISVDPDKELLRLENLCRDGIDPRIVGLRMKSVAIKDGGFTIVIRIPRSWNPPHRVSARNTNRFYARNAAGAYEVNVDELRVMQAHQLRQLLHPIGQPSFGSQVECFADLGNSPADYSDVDASRSARRHFGNSKRLG